VVRLNGSAVIDLGGDPHGTTTLTARQIDLDRLLPNSELKRLPFETVKLLVGDLATLRAAPMPIHISLGIDSVMAGGATRSAPRGEGENSAGGWRLDTPELRAPRPNPIPIPRNLTT